MHCIPHQTVIKEEMKSTKIVSIWFPNNIAEWLWRDWSTTTVITIWSSVPKLQHGILYPNLHIAKLITKDKEDSFTKTETEREKKREKKTQTETVSAINSFFDILSVLFPVMVIRSVDRFSNYYNPKKCRKRQIILHGLPDTEKAVAYAATLH